MLRAGPVARPRTIVYNRLANSAASFSRAIHDHLHQRRFIPFPAGTGSWEPLCARQPSGFCFASRPPGFGSSRQRAPPKKQPSTLGAGPVANFVPRVKGAEMERRS
jgi:hypothetical protein